MKIMKYGFTIIELLIVIGIVVIVAVAGFLGLYSFRGEKYLDLTSQEIINVLRDAQDRSISREEDGHWGVHFENSAGGDNFYELFKGASYADSVKYSRFSLKPSIKFNDPASGANTDIIFQPITGWPNTPTTIKISSKNDSSKNTTIVISANGLISLPSSLPQISSWTSLVPTLASIDAGGSLTSVGADAVYALRGAAYSAFWKYTISAGNWQSLPDVPGQIGVGVDGDLVSVGNDSIYALRAADAGQDNFWRYNISAGNWTNLADIPNVGGLYYPIVLIAVGNEIYANKGTTLNNFYKYNISTGIWTMLANSPLLYDGSDATVIGNAIYATKGSYEKIFYKYTISSNSWSNLADAPLGIGLGGSLTTVGTDIYALRGEGTNNFWKYDTLTNIWSDAANALGDVYDGGSLTTVGTDTIYALGGWDTTSFWRFDIF
ncbi:hypothetical protein A3G50_02490 [Candidatus Jorgensenbacteria bacterium RIFCSPLOWO2_12_FULL_42_11]|uniref:Bulb-type lectin domain-containing protein n=1 Tax=Candidatus Jorgensenbacteria bacterium RIFCSPLOWO2_12_FULL_42_11 TaxID=1798473 RepID=A0A1F6C2L8_9BACT|nr:MAG: hypothetical protein A3G50_02490 [Candidatus Jorgensenbacteria bacterium RIFCSPLOWO2_12_FULL_42_11]